MGCPLGASSYVKTVMTRHANAMGYALTKLSMVKKISYEL
jgi:hypothetical protein